GKLLKAAIPLEITVSRGAGASGATAPQVLYRSTDRGRWTGQIAAGLFDGDTMTISVRELLSGKAASAQVTVKGGGYLDTKQGSVLVENALALPGFFKAAKSVYVVIGEHTPEAAVEPLVKALRGRNIDALVRRASQVAVKRFDTNVGRGLARINSDILWSAGETFELDRPAIVIGSAADNRLLNYVLWDRQWTTCGAMGGFPGPGKGYVSFLWRPFSLVDDGIIAVADDADGIEAAVKFLAKSAK
ncbi:MAG TPA: hypothetical protein VM186_08980, partial [Planctomycetota bacterium]|nr:hypothetical protein [Planctomycetota bacterium]